MENWMTLALILAGLGSFALGLLCLGCSAYLFARKRSLARGRVPVWVIMLVVGLFLTLLIPGAIAFLLMQAILSSTPVPTVTCYEAAPQVTCYKPAAALIMPAIPVAMRLELLERLRERDMLPEHVYRKTKR